MDALPKAWLPAPCCSSLLCTGSSSPGGAGLGSFPQCPCTWWARLGSVLGLYSNKKRGRFHCAGCWQLPSPWKLWESYDGNLKEIQLGTYFCRSPGPNPLFPLKAIKGSEWDPLTQGSIQMEFELCYFHNYIIFHKCFGQPAPMFEQLHCEIFLVPSQDFSYCSLCLFPYFSFFFYFIVPWSKNIHESFFF